MPKKFSEGCSVYADFDGGAPWEVSEVNTDQVEFGDARLSDRIGGGLIQQDHEVRG